MKIPGSVSAPVPPSPVPASSAPVEDLSGPEPEILRAVMDNLEEAVVVFTSDGRAGFVNAPAQRLYGIAPQTPLSTWSETCGLYRPDRKTPWPAEELPAALALQG